MNVAVPPTSPVEMLVLEWGSAKVILRLESPSTINLCKTPPKSQCGLNHHDDVFAGIRRYATTSARRSRSTANIFTVTLPN